MDSTEHNNKKYSIDYGETQMDFRNQIRIKKIIDLIDPCEKLLDLGCWDGFIMKEILKSGKAKSTIGLDNSRSAVEMGKKNNLDIRLVESVDRNIPFEKNSFDCVYAGEIIEHIYDVNNFLAEIKRVLKKNGQIIITTPNLASLGSRIRLLFGRTPWMIENLLEDNAAGHIRYFTFDTLSAILEDRKFLVASCSTNAIQVGKINLSNRLIRNHLYKFGSTIIVKSINKKG